MTAEGIGQRRRAARRARQRKDQRDRPPGVRGGVGDQDDQLDKRLHEEQRGQQEICPERVDGAHPSEHRVQR